jgi:hypothetical protein
MNIVGVIAFLFIQAILLTFMMLWRNRAIKSEILLSQVTIPPYTITESDLQEIVDSLDDTGGYIVKESELKYWIETHVKRATAPKP